MRFIQLKKKLVDIISQLDEYDYYQNSQFTYLQNIFEEEIQMKMNELSKLFEIHQNSLEKIISHFGMSDWMNNKEELEAFSWLTDLFIHESIYISEKTTLEKTGQTVFRTLAGVYQEVELEEMVGTGEFFLSIGKSDEYHKFHLFELLGKSELVEVNGWNLQLQKIFAEEFKEFKGYLYHERYKKYPFIKLFSQALSILDISMIFEIKKALFQSKSFIINENSVYFNCANGVMAQVRFYKRSELSKFYLNQDTECFYELGFDGRTQFIPLVKQRGYTDSEIGIEIPVGYLIKTKDYNIRINFFANQLTATGILNLVHDMPSANKLKDIEEEERQAWLYED